MEGLELFYFVDKIVPITDSIKFENGVQIIERSLTVYDRKSREYGYRDVHSFRIVSDFVELRENVKVLWNS